MALVKCSECGRTISDRAPACVGCGAPLTPHRALNIAPPRSRRPPPTRSQLRARGLLYVLAFALGVAGSSLLAHAAGTAHVVATVAALLVVLGLCGGIVTAVQWLMLRR